MIFWICETWGNGKLGRNFNATDWSSRPTDLFARSSSNLFSEWTVEVLVIPLDLLCKNDWKTLPHKDQTERGRFLVGVVVQLALDTRNTKRWLISYKGQWWIMLVPLDDGWWMIATRGMVTKTRQKYQKPEAPNNQEWIWGRNRGSSSINLGIFLCWAFLVSLSLTTKYLLETKRQDTLYTLYRVTKLTGTINNDDRCPEKTASFIAHLTPLPAQSGTATVSNEEQRILFRIIGRGCWTQRKNAMLYNEHQRSIKILDDQRWVSGRLEEIKERYFIRKSWSVHYLVILCKINFRLATR